MQDNTEGSKVMEHMEKNFVDIFNDAVDALETDAEAAGTNITAVCRDAGVSRAAPVRWKKEPPLTVRLVAKMQDRIKEIKKENSAPQE